MIPNFKELKKFGLSNMAIAMIESYGQYENEPRGLEEIKKVADSCSIKLHEPAVKFQQAFGGLKFDGPRIDNGMCLGFMRHKSIDTLDIHMHREYGQMIRCGEINNAPDSFWITKDSAIFFGTELKVAGNFIPIIEEQAIYFDSALRTSFAFRLWIDTQYLTSVSQFLEQTTERNRVYDKYNRHYFGKSIAALVTYGYGTEKYLVVVFSDKSTSAVAERVAGIASIKSSRIQKFKYSKGVGWK
jgi:hypothetical protein